MICQRLQVWYIIHWTSLPGPHSSVHHLTNLWIYRVYIVWVWVHIVFQNMSLWNLYDQFCRCLSLHQEFWDIVDEIDKKTWVLEPDVPRPDIISRRIALGRRVEAWLQPIFKSWGQSVSGEWRGNRISKIGVQYCSIIQSVSWAKVSMWRSRLKCQVDPLHSKCQLKPKKSNCVSLHVNVPWCILYTCFLVFPGNSSSLQIKIDPRHPRSLPECKFLGADQGKVVWIKA